ncbi:hypothetical protein PV783_34330 [Chitinophaga sp. CC14]|uniref:hypothetical protein n=1 Tax=Chitinophaga sp. CC14 TaxID=3029199 RepID=UPI003B7FF96A
MASLLGSHLPNRTLEHYSENKDHYFANLIANMTAEQQEKLPAALAFKVSKGPEYAQTSMKPGEKDYVMQSSFGTMFFEMVLTPDGMDVEQFLSHLRTLLNNSHKPNSNKAAAEALHTEKIFIRGGHDLMKRMEYLELICATEMYKLADSYRSSLKASRILNKKARRVTASIEGILEFLLAYENNKARFVNEIGLELADLFLMMFLYSGGRKRKAFYEKLAYAKGKNNKGLKMTFTRLKSKGFSFVKGERTSSAEHYLSWSGKEAMIKFIKRVFNSY